jgi:hypothetical protein
MHDITIRQMPFEFPDEIDPMVIPGRPEESYANVGLSLLLPYLEPYLIRTMKEARKHIGDPDLRADLDAFNAQEGQHYRQHMKFNDAVRGFGFPGLAELEAELAADYRRFSESRSLRFNLAYAEGFEALTTASAHTLFDEGFHPDMDPHMKALLEWHLIEELEHRTVAFDVYHHVCPGWLYRTAVGLWAQWHMLSWIGRATACMIRADTRVETECGGKAGRKARQKEASRRFRKNLWPRLWRLHLPWYTPHHITMTPEMHALADRYSKLAVRTSHASIS